MTGLVLFDESRGTPEVGSDRTDLDLHVAEVVLTLTAVEARPRHTRHDPLEIGQQFPGLIDARGDGEFVLQLHDGSFRIRAGRSTSWRCLR